MHSTAAQTLSQEAGAGQAHASACSKLSSVLCSACVAHTVCRALGGEEVEVGGEELAVPICKSLMEL